MKIVIDLEKELYKYICNHYTGKDTPYLAIIDGLVLPDNVLTVERPQGEWIDVKNIPYLANCSNCGYQMDTHEEHGYFNYCPYCGADMRGDKE